MPSTISSRDTSASTISMPAYGPVVEYIEGRIYLASFTRPPTPQTPFHYPYKQEKAQTPSKRSGRARLAAAEAVEASIPPVYFSVDELLLYNAFYADFGPLHIGHLYRFAVYLHNILGDPAHEKRRIVLWSRPDARSRANMACLFACYMVLLQSWAPHQALAPIAQADPPYMPFRDAGYSRADYIITIQDVVYGVWRAKEEGICDLHAFNLDEYEAFERADMGDFNWITPAFIALASPIHDLVEPILPADPRFAALPHTITAVEESALPVRFQNVLIHFAARGVGLVVRLNSELYSPSFFQALGIGHIDMIFDDGTCPPLRMVKKFIRLAHDTIERKRRAVAVHCKAGLGRTGCLIGAYLIYRYAFTANETIAYMRFMRPGMVVGPQQHWLHLHQATFREWWWEDLMKEKLAAVLPTTPSKSSSAAHHRRAGGASKVNSSTPATPDMSQAKRSPLGEVNRNETSSPGGQSNKDDALPAPTPGQPRKMMKHQPQRSPSFDRHGHHHHHARSGGYGVSSTRNDEVRLVSNGKDAAAAAAAAIEWRVHAENGQKKSMIEEEAEAEEEAAAANTWEVRMRAPKRMASSSRQRSPRGIMGRRSVSCAAATMTTTTTIIVSGGEDGAQEEGGDDGEAACAPVGGAESDVENQLRCEEERQRQQQQQQQQQTRRQASRQQRHHQQTHQHHQSQPLNDYPQQQQQQQSPSPSPAVARPPRTSSMKSGSGAGRLAMSKVRGSHNHNNSKSSPTTTAAAVAANGVATTVSATVATSVDASAVNPPPPPPPSPERRRGGGARGSGSGGGHNHNHHGEGKHAAGIRKTSGRVGSLGSGGAAVASLHSASSVSAVMASAVASVIAGGGSSGGATAATTAVAAAAAAGGSVGRR